MRGGEVDDSGRFEPFTADAKEQNLIELRNAIGMVKVKDPEAFEVSRRWAIMDQLPGAKKWSDVPDSLTIYRGMGKGEDLARAANFTFQESVAKQFGEVNAFEINKNDIGFVFWHSVFPEGELFVFDTSKARRTALKGGEGSGNFGHAGRPGEVGGSSPSVGYHGTTEAALDSILKNGIIPKADRTFDEKSLYEGDRAGAVFYAENKKHAEIYAYSRWSSEGELRGSNAVILKLQIPETAQPKIDKEHFGRRKGEAYYLKGKIPPEWIVGYEVYQMSRYGNKTRSIRKFGDYKVDGTRVAYVLVWTPNDEEAKKEERKGGEGSGNFGHVGRPGEVGGSAPGESGKFAPMQYTVPKSARKMPDGSAADFTPEKGGWLFHGTRMPDDQEYLEGDANGVVYMTDDYGEAAGYASGIHLGGKGGGTERVLHVQMGVGKMANIDKEISTAVLEGGGEEDFGPIFDRARKQGYSYAYYTHPSNVDGSKEQRVIVVLNPGDLIGSNRHGWDMKKNKPWRFKRDWKADEDYKSISTIRGMDVEKWISELFPKIRKEFRAALRASFQYFVRKHTINGLVWTENDERVTRAIDALSYKTKTIAGSFEEALTKQIDEGVSQRETTDQLAERVSMFFDDQVDYRAKRIAVTTSNTAMNTGNDIAAKQAGIFKYKTWVTFRDEKVREAHQDLDGVKIPIEGKFLDRFTGDHLDYPGDPSAVDVKSVVNCRCNLVYS
jgi:hypothetical protein